MNYKILKLKNGEELIADISETKVNIKLIDPMVFRTTTLLDGYNKPYDLTILKDWLLFNESKTIELRKSNFISISKPSIRSVKLYLLEKDRLKNIKSEDILPIKDLIEKPNKNKKSKLKDLSPEQNDEIMNEMEDVFNDIFNSIKKLPPEKFNDYMDSQEEDFDPLLPGMPPAMNKDFIEKKMIYMTMVFPPEMILNLISSGILSPKDFGKLVKQVLKENKFTGDEKHRKDFGNKWTDWNPDIHGDEYK